MLRSQVTTADYRILSRFCCQVQAPFFTSEDKLQDYDTKEFYLIPKSTFSTERTRQGVFVRSRHEHMTLQFCVLERIQKNTRNDDPCASP
jgi:hypothetical protein